MLPWLPGSLPTSEREVAVNTFSTSYPDTVGDGLGEGGYGAGRESTILLVGLGWVQFSC